MANAAAKAYDVLLEALQSGQFDPGQRLHENDLSDLVGVSRTPIREALRQLTADGILRFQTGRGVHVAEWSTEELMELYELRALVEGHAAGRAAKKMTPDALERLRELADDMEGLAQDRRLDEVAAKNTEFHNLIAEVGCGAQVVPVLSSVVKIHLVNRTFQRYSPTDLHRSMTQHRELLEACEQGHSEWAAATMRAHILAASSTLTRNADADPPATSVHAQEEEPPS
ncbi:GntR family transcriptional regulator [Oryzobacter telluris]|uniref:GntR family transcriptional regulator n=1 Tax=Oryzobacter telluris TaxID=3149179 RepID=UPI00370DDB47